MGCLLFLLGIYFITQTKDLQALGLILILASMFGDFGSGKATT